MPRRVHEERGKGEDSLCRGSCERLLERDLTRRNSDLANFPNRCVYILQSVGLKLFCESNVTFRCVKLCVEVLSLWFIFERSLNTRLACASLNCIERVNRYTRRERSSAARQSRRSAATKDNARDKSRELIRAPQEDYGFWGK